MHNTHIHTFTPTYINATCSILYYLHIDDFRAAYLVLAAYLVWVSLPWMRLSLLLSAFLSGL